MAKQSAQHKLDRVRPPRVQITYDVEIGGAIEIKELPFVVGVLGDFTGNPEQPLPKLKERKFVEVNPDNFDTVLEGMKPHLSFAVENKLSDDPDAPNLKVDLKFSKLDDFEPANVAKQVKPLKELLDLRTRLSDLRGSLQGNDKLEELLARSCGQHREAGQAERRNWHWRVQWLKQHQIKRPLLPLSKRRKEVCSIKLSSKAGLEPNLALGSAARTWSRSLSPRCSMAP